MPTITTTYQGGTVFETHIGDHGVIADSSKATAPTPPQLFVASIGACVVAVVSSYCNRVGIDATDLRVDVSYEGIDNPYRLGNFQVTIHLPNAELGKREEALRRVAEHCPVHESIAQWTGINFIIHDGSILEPA